MNINFVDKTVFIVMELIVYCSSRNIRSRLTSYPAPSMRLTRDRVSNTLQNTPCIWDIMYTRNTHEVFIEGVGICIYGLIKIKNKTFNPLVYFIQRYDGF